MATRKTQTPANGESELPKGQDKIITFSSSDATLNHVNQRYEGKDANKRLALDLKFILHVDRALLQDLAAADDVMPLWDNEGKLKYRGINNLESRIELPNATLEFGDLAMNKLELKEVKVKAFKFTPVEGYALKMVCTAQVHPTDKELIDITHAAHKTAQLVVTCNLGPIGVVVPSGDDDDMGQLFPTGDEDDNEDEHPTH